ncbi:MAG: hypothetical protein EBZ58_09505 [Bacteroidetes bacterium]|jgi:hypothetical protein|nr:hypothetical protein [Bacteroidota bacterium]
MDNNQQSKGVVQQPANPPAIVSQAGPDGGQVSAPQKDLGVNNPGTVATGTPFTGKDVSMTTPQYAGGNITSTEAGSK